MPSVRSPSRTVETVVQIRHPDQLRRLVDDVTHIFEQFLAKTREPVTVEHQWAAVLKGLTMGPDFLFALALDRHVRPVGYVIAQAGSDFLGVRYGNIIQTYAQPVRGVTDALWRTIQAWGTAREVQAYSGLTRNVGPVYHRWVSRFGFTPYALIYVTTQEVPDLGEIPTHSADHSDAVS